MSAKPWHAIEVRTSPVVRGLLEQLVHTGLYGQTIEEAADIILTQHLREQLLAGTIDNLRDATAYLRLRP